MFLTYLSGYDYEERYWAFVFRFETLVGGVVAEASKRIGSYTDEQALEFFFEAFARLLNVNSGITPPGWWQDVDAPSYMWFERYMEREAPYMIREARRRAEVSDSELQDDCFDRKKARQLAHKNASFQKFLLGDNADFNRND